ncbi:2-oxoglutarate oxidoreductase alpha subunit [Desulfocucumis palustris]|uniref:2-oxoglutarate oxidoreductase alpha subunit n=1 Tax=Desulfocucumis palustris TaxID=1898651 RepID=A0A2L2XBF8_9FIRM|nr:2-oxoglutarate ferredoxin oxidoreductase subunit alpha [Desulfocucumis palustris]GBF33314.1 2-oxoglutarate oxidoreductase alpha subunit [Desulfocucumis palustris]
MKRYFDTGNRAITEGAILAGCKVFAGYPITPATEIAENMSRRLPEVGGYYVQAEDEMTGMHIAVGASLGGLKTMTATSGPGYILYADPYGWALGCEIPIVVVNAQRVGPVSGITGAPGQGEFYIARYPTHGGNAETIVLAPNSVQEAFSLTVEAFYLSERFRMPVTVLADQLVTDGWETLELPETREEIEKMGLRFKEREICRGPVFYPFTDQLDVPPVVMGHNTGGTCSDWTPTDEGYDTEEVEWAHKHSYRLINKVRNNKEVIRRYEEHFMDDDPDVVLVAYGSPSRVMISCVKKAREEGLKVGCIRPISLWPFLDDLYHRKTNYLVVELNYDGQLVREVQRCVPTGSNVHFFGKCGELPSVAEMLLQIKQILNGEPLVRSDNWEWEAW